MEPQLHMPLPLPLPRTAAHWFRSDPACANWTSENSDWMELAGTDGICCASHARRFGVGAPAVGSQLPLETEDETIWINPSCGTLDVIGLSVRSLLTDAQSPPCE